MKLKKYALIGIMALLVIAGCDNKGSDKKDKDKVKVANVKKDISNEEIAKYNEYLKVSDVPNSEEWNTFFTEIKKLNLAICIVKTQVNSTYKFSLNLRFDFFVKR